MSGIELVSGRSLLDEGETRDAVERVGLHFEPGIGDILSAAGTDSIGTCMEGRECLFDPAKFFEGEQLHGQGDIELMLGCSLVDRVWEGFRFCGDQMGHRGFVCEYRSKPIEFILKICVIRVFLRLNVSMY